MAGYSKVDALPLHKRIRVIDTLMNGGSLRAAAEGSGLSAMSIHRYKQHALQGIDNKGLPVDVAIASPFRARLDAVYARIERTCDEVKPNERAPLFGQLHKNLELLGKATGELRDESAQNAHTDVQVAILQIPRLPHVETAAIESRPVSALANGIPALEQPKPRRRGPRTAQKPELFPPL